MRIQIRFSIRNDVFTNIISDHDLRLALKTSFKKIVKSTVFNL